MKRINNPRVFHGKNFMTPEVVGYFSLRPGLYAELSKGEGFYGEDIFGVTVRNSHEADPDKLSKLCKSWDEAIEYMTELERRP